jgi:hypothetical protein
LGVILPENSIPVLMGNLHGVLEQVWLSKEEHERMEAGVADLKRRIAGMAKIVPIFPSRDE